MNKLLQHAPTVDEMIAHFQAAKDQIGGSAKVVANMPFTRGGVACATFEIVSVSKTGDAKTVFQKGFKCVKIGYK